MGRIHNEDTVAPAFSSRAEHAKPRDCAKSLSKEPLSLAHGDVLVRELLAPGDAQRAPARTTEATSDTLVAQGADGSREHDQR